MEPFLLVLISLSASFLSTSLAASVPDHYQESCSRFSVCDLRTEYCRKDVMNCESCAVDCHPDVIADHPGEQATCLKECAVYYRLTEQSVTSSTPPVITSPHSTPEVGSKTPGHVWIAVCSVLALVIIILVAVAVCCYRRRTKANTGVNHSGRGIISQEQGDLAGAEEVPLQTIRPRDIHDSLPSSIEVIRRENSASASSRTDGETDPCMSHGTMVDGDQTEVWSVS